MVLIWVDSTVSHNGFFGGSDVWDRGNNLWKGFVAERACYGIGLERRLAWI